MTNQMESPGYDSDYMADDDYDHYGSDVDDEEVVELRQKKRRICADVLDEVDALRDENIEFRGGSNEVDFMNGLEAYYQDSDNAASPISSEDDGNAAGGGTKKKKKRTIAYPRFNKNISMEGFDLEVGMLFRNKKQLTDAIENYRIYKGYALKITISDKDGFRAVCRAEGCEWKLWASKPQREESFQIKKMPKPHSCIPYNFEKGMRSMSTSWLACKYKETFRLQPNLRLRELRDLIDRDHLYKPSMAMCFRTRVKALSLLLGDYKEQFGMLWDYANELMSKNPLSTVKIKVDTNENGESIFNSMYICVSSLRKDF